MGSGISAAVLLVVAPACGTNCSHRLSGGIPSIKTCKLVLGDNSLDAEIFGCSMWIKKCENWVDKCVC